MCEEALAALPPAEDLARAAMPEEGAAAGRAQVLLASANHQTLHGSFSAVWTATIASKDGFYCIFRDLQDLHPFAPF